MVDMNAGWQICINCIGLMAAGFAVVMIGVSAVASLCAACVPTDETTPCANMTTQEARTDFAANALAHLRSY